MRKKIIATTLSLALSTAMCPAIALAELTGAQNATATSLGGEDESALSGTGYDLSSAAVTLEKGPYYYRDVQVTPKVTVSAMPTAAQVSELLAAKQQAQNALTDANANKKSADDAFAVATARNKTAQATLTSAQSTARAAAQNASEKAAAYETAKSTYESASAALPEKKTAYEAALAPYEEAKAKRDAAQATYDSASAKYDTASSAVKTARTNWNAVKNTTYEKQSHNSDEFFKDMNSNAAYGLVTGTNIDGTTYSGARVASVLAETDLDSDTDATSIDNMVYAISMIDRYNELRTAAGLSAVGVTDYNMALEQGSVNWSDTNVGHSSGCGNENLAWGYTDPSRGWYYEEKEVFDAEYMRITGSTTGCPGPEVYSWYTTNRSQCSFAGVVGHYINFMNPRWTSMGMAYDANGSYGGGDCWGENFSAGISSTRGTVYTASDYRSRFITWLTDKYVSDGMTTADATTTVNGVFAKADAYVAFGTANTNYALAYNEKKDAGAALTSAQEAFDPVEAEYTAAKADYDAALAKVTASKTAMDTAEQEKDGAASTSQQANQALTQAQQNANDAQIAANAAQAAATQAAQDATQAEAAYNSANTSYEEAAAGNPVTLTEGVHYSVSYANNDAIGTATVTVTGIGSNTGQTSRTFEIEEYNPWPTEGLEGFVARLYRDILDRQPEAAGYYFQLAALRAGASPAEIAYNYFNSEEYFAKHETPQKTVERVYQVMFGRAPGNGEEAGWVEKMEVGMSVRYVLQGFSQSQEYRNYFGSLGLSADAIELYNANADKAWDTDGNLVYAGGNDRDRNEGATAFAKRMYTIVLGRSDVVGVDGGIDVAGLNVQAGAIVNGMACWQIATNYFDSAEFKNNNYGNYDAVAIAYEAILGRAGSDSEIRGWVEEKEDKCYSVADLVLHFCNSNEFNAICESYGLTSGMRGETAPSLPGASEHTWSGSVCTHCGKVVQVAHTHAWGGYAYNNDATCEGDGTETRTCACGESETRTASGTAFGHDYSKSSVSTPATCTTAGVRTYVCSNDSSHTYVEAVPALGHDYVNGFCTRCGVRAPIIASEGGPFASIDGLTFTNGVDYPWTDDGDRIVSSNVGIASAPSTFTLTANRAGTLSFGYEVSPGVSQGSLNVSVNGVVREGWNCAASGTYSVTLAQGDVVEISYEKESCSCRNCAWVGSASFDSVTTSPFANATVGDVVSFGSYEQDGDTTNGSEAIKWQVLAIDGNKALVTTCYAIECLPFNESGGECVWADSSLRSWLNSDFLSSTFSVEQRSLIPVSELQNGANPWHGTSSGGATYDRVFLLSYSEFASYLGDGSTGKCACTAYASAKGAYEANGSTTWYLRTAGKTQSSAMMIDASGYAYATGVGVASTNRAVRPAMWVKM